MAALTPWCAMTAVLAGALRIRFHARPTRVTNAAQDSPPGAATRTSSQAFAEPARRASALPAATSCRSTHPYRFRTTPAIHGWARVKATPRFPWHGGAAQMLRSPAQAAAPGSTAAPPDLRLRISRWSRTAVGVVTKCELLNTSLTSRIYLTKVFADVQRRSQIVETLDMPHLMGEHGLKLLFSQ